YKEYAAFNPEQIKSATGNRGTFDPNDPNILNQGGDATRAQIGFGDDITKQASVMSLFAGANLSSFLHEGAHFFLEVHSDLATRNQQQIDSGASVSDQERGIVDDMRKLLGWFGVKGRRKHRRAQHLVNEL
ncbi:MAG: hypothetical protein IPO08_21890, partial [Xanthomonadales bacterium]|nr:hypothetical protein [Xanthomonadales bacterium]